MRWGDSIWIMGIWKKYDQTAGDVGLNARVTQPLHRRTSTCMLQTNGNGKSITRQKLHALVRCASTFTWYQMKREPVADTDSCTK